MIAIYVLIYNTAIHLYLLGIWIASFFNAKAKKWILGRKNILERLANDFQHNENSIWIHCASLGEFEQGRPLIELLKKDLPNVKILLTFFSPSGFEIRKDYPLADWVYYLPIDAKKYVPKFIEIVKPQIAIFIKYEFWFHYLSSLKKANIPTFLASAIFRKDQIFFKWYGQLYREMLTCFSTIFVQDKFSQNLLNEIGFQNVEAVGDTRIDRVSSIPKTSRKFPLIEQFSGKSKVLVAGSTWSKDEDLLLDIINENHFPDWKFILAPHEINQTHISAIERNLSVPFLKYSEISQGLMDAGSTEKKVLIIDNIGMLSSIYQFGKIAYIGGGFGAGIHNILEPGAWGLPVIFGPNFHKFKEAKDMIQSKSAFSFKHKNDLVKIIEELENPGFFKLASENAAAFIMQNKGASLEIVKEVVSIIQQKNN